ncbi:LysR family transcriptional regulator [Burkholderia sp. ABCPW 14]|uniref:LysR substrate-binding domain-containing protein n=1 Tax=Burkholderia sp. ABCPW 14 TaxID=1637860 RepID=UPI000770DF46|nr:LysR family transcriptional regulator [Burkholderia sp. ABCPW 14]KVD86653.1 LysR family transcriptional regulator [Burkholderia sp. ABCPW 14]
MDRFDALQAFARVVEAGSFTKAAQTLHISKTTVTQLVQQLEARLRVKLLNRTTRQVKLTADGAAYYERIARLLADLEDADASLSSASASPKGRLRVDVPSPFALMILVPALPAFHARYPDIQLDIGVSDRMVDLIGDNVDCVLRGGDLPDSSLIARRIGELRLGVYAAPRYLDAAGTPSHPRELNGTHHRIVGFLSPRSGRVACVALRRDGERGESIRIESRYAVAIDDGNAYLAAGLAGLGVLWLPHYMAEAPVARRELVPLFDDWALEPMPMYLAYPPNRHLGMKLKVFIAWVEELMARHAPISAARDRRHGAAGARDPHRRDA